jgi:hypothetical protein
MQPQIIKECTTPGGVDNRYAPRPKTVDGDIRMSTSGDVSAFDVINHTLKQGPSRPGWNGPKMDRSGFT